MFDIVVSLEDYSFFLGPAVVAEIVELRAFIDERISRQTITVLPDNELMFDEVGDFADENNLGLGESECILFCIRRPELNVCSDDRRARRITAERLGPNRLVGTSDLLRTCVQQGLLTAQDAFAAYEQMRIRGAFLPALSRDDFIA